jgi:predicted NUDIX family NTP pyrophosphohydrolase
MTKRSAGLLVYRLTNHFPEIFLGHPGGPFYVRKDLGVWSIPKGEFETEKPLTAAKREFFEETGFKVKGEFIDLGWVKQKSVKIVYAWGCEFDLDASKLKSNLFTLEFPARSGNVKQYPEIDRGGWFDIDTAKQKILTYQLPFLSRLQSILSASPK